MEKEQVKHTHGREKLKKKKYIHRDYGAGSKILQIILIEI